jgi:hypothetical protein
LAVFRPTPGKASKSLRFLGTCCYVDQSKFTGFNDIFSFRVI